MTRSAAHHQKPETYVDLASDSDVGSVSNQSHSRITIAAAAMNGRKRRINDDDDNDDDMMTPADRQFAPAHIQPISAISNNDNNIDSDGNFAVILADRANGRLATPKKIGPNATAAKSRQQRKRCRSDVRDKIYYHSTPNKTT